MPLDNASAKRYVRTSAFLEWCKKDGFSVIGGYGFDDLKIMPLKHWERLGGPAAEPVRFATANNLPLVMNVYNSPDFVFNVPYEFIDRFAGQKDFFSSELQPGEDEDRVVNFIPDLNAVTLDPHPERGIGFSRLGIHLSGNSMVRHIMAIESGTYKKTHRGGGGAQVIVIVGKGYSLMWYPGKEFVRVDWKPGSLPSFAEGHGCKPVDECEVGTLRSLGEGGYASEGSARRSVWRGATAVRPWGSTRSAGRLVSRSFHHQQRAGRSSRAAPRAASRRPIHGGRT